MDEREQGLSSNLEQGGDVRMSPESRLRETETLVNTQWMDKSKMVVVRRSQNHKHHQTSCKQNNENITPPSTTCRRTDVQREEDSRRYVVPIGTGFMSLGEEGCKVSVNRLV